jgi:spermidine/putrescine transport system substrate-binding protein
MALSRRRFARLALASMLAPAAGCKKSKKSLSLYNWGSYLAAEVLRRFEASIEGGARLVEDFFLSEAEMVAKLEAGGTYDVVFCIDYLLSSMQKKGLMQPLQPMLSGIEHLDPNFGVWHARADRGGKAYAIPYLWGTTGIGYDRDKVDPPTSWNALFDERYAGHIAVLDSKGDVMDQALLALGMSINSTDKPRIRNEVYPKLQEQKKILRAYDSDPARALVSGDVWIAQIDSGDLLHAQAQKPSLRYVIPQEGAALWTDYMVIGAHAAHVGLAREFMEFLLDPEIAAINANELRFATPNKTALDRGLIHDADDPNVYPPPEMKAKLFTSENWFGKTGALVEELWLELRAQ